MANLTAPNNLLTMCCIVLFIFVVSTLFHPVDTDHSNNSCASFPEHVRHGCKMVALMWAEGRKAEAEGRIVSAKELPPPSSGIGLPCFRDATREEQQAQPPPKVVAERYACLNMTCLCPFFGGNSPSHDQCMLPILSPTTTIGSSSAAVSRVRRQSGTPNLSLGRAVRMEYRMLSDSQRARFHAVLQQLKRGIGSYEYDRLSFLHSNPAMMPSAHGGPTFLLWHREFVKRFEIAIRAADPSVAVPYWDSSMDGRLPNPADSVMWSSLFMGAPTAAGTIADGPFASWITPSGGPIRRQLGSGGGTLFSEQQIASIIRNPQISHILAFTGRGGGCSATNPGNVLEFVHNNIHIWVGGDMGPLTTSPQDPIFFLHHSFIDFIFEQWRQLNQNRQQRETQYPDDAQILACAGSPNYRLNATMLPFQDPVVFNGAGLSNSYTDSLYTYAPRPTCRAPGGCGSPYLFCDTISGGGSPLCTARIKSGGNCARFASNADSPCFASACVNGRCQAVAAAQPSTAQQQQRRVRSIVSSPFKAATFPLPNYPVGQMQPPQHQSQYTTVTPMRPQAMSSSNTTAYSILEGTKLKKQPLQHQQQHHHPQYNNTVLTTTPMPPFTSSTTIDATAFGGWHSRALTTPSPTPSPRRHICFDNHECCAHWAAADACRAAPRHMNTWCPGTCRYDGCRPHPKQGESECKDLYSECQRWAHYHEKFVGTLNECERNPHWMAQNCAKACQKCNTQSAQSAAAEQCIKNMPKDYKEPRVDFD